MVAAAVTVVSAFVIVPVSGSMVSAMS